MALRLICGPTGSGKTKRAIEVFLAALERGEKAVFIAPSGPDVRHFQRRILSVQPVLTDGWVTTFDGLYQTCRQDEAGKKRILSAGERDLLLRALARGPGKPEMLALSARFDGFFSDLADLLSDLEALGIGPARLGEDLKAWSRGDKWRQGLNRDLFRLYHEYAAALEEQGAQDAQQAARAAVEKFAQDASLLEFTTVVIDGFHDFTPLELELVNIFTASVPELAITLPYQEGKAAFTAPARLFEILAGGADIELLESPGAGGGAQAIAHIAENLFEEDAGRIEAGAAVTVLQAAGVRGQAELVAAEVLRLWREEEVELDDIAVVSRGQGADSTALAAAFADFGIPYELSAPAPLLETHVGRVVASALDIAAGRGGRESLFTYLRCVMPAAMQSRVDDLDRHARRRGIEDQAALIWEWNQSGGRPLAEIERLKKAALAGLQTLSMELLAVVSEQVSGDLNDAPIADCRPGCQVIAKPCGYVWGDSPAFRKTQRASFPDGGFISGSDRVVGPGTVA